MTNNLFKNDYKNFKEMTYLDGGSDVSALYISDIEVLKDQKDNNYLDITDVQTSLKEYYKKQYDTTLDIDELEKDIMNSFIMNEELSKNNLKNKLNYAIKTENLDKNIKNNELYNTALQRMVEEDISLDTMDIEKVKSRTSQQNALFGTKKIL